MLLLGGVLRADNFKCKPRIWRPNADYPWLLRAYFDVSRARRAPPLSNRNIHARMALAWPHHATCLYLYVRDCVMSRHLAPRARS